MIDYRSMTMKIQLYEEQDWVLDDQNEASKLQLINYLVLYQILMDTCRKEYCFPQSPAK